MKILAIRGCNLASLAGEFEIDLAKGPLGAAGVFAIVGPTGAGKSTLLDAMCVALFDRTPRLANRSTVVVGRGEDDPTALGAQDVRSILRRGASAGWAEVDFESGDARRYRARWSVRRARNATDGRFQSQQLSLTALDGRGDGAQLGGTKTETLEAIHARLGLSFDQFRRSALLAQGEFAAFLRADGKDRSELLERMTGTEIYSRLSVAAHLRASLAEQQLRERHGAAMAIPVLSDDERGKAEGDLALAKDAQKAARARLAAAEVAARWLAELGQRERALEAAEVARRSAEQAVEAAATERAELGLRRRAEALRSAWEEVTRLDRQLITARADASTAVDVAARADETLRAIDVQRVRLAELHTPIRAARIASGLVERTDSTMAGRDRGPRRLGRGTGGPVDRDPPARRAVPGTLTGRDDDALAEPGAAFEVDATLERPAAAELAARATLEARATTALDDARWLDARSRMPDVVARWRELDARVAQYMALAGEIAANDKTLAERATARARLVSQRTAIATDHQAAVTRLGEAQAEAGTFEKRRGLTLDAARRAEDEARKRCTDVEKLVVIATEARSAAAARAEIDAQLAELTTQAGVDRDERTRLEAERGEAEIMRRERARVLDDLRKAAGYEHARAELVDGDPCPLCGGTEHPWAHRGSLDALIVDAEARLREAVERGTTAVGHLAMLAARDVQRGRESERLAVARRKSAATVAAAATSWRKELAALGELLLVDDPATDEAAHLAIDRTEAARAKLETARSARSQAEAIAKAAAEAQGRVQARQADVEHHAAALRDIDKALATMDAAIERVRGERAGKVERVAELLGHLHHGLASWERALAPDDAARPVVELVLEAVAPYVGSGPTAETHVGGLERSSAKTHVGAAPARTGRNTHVGALERGSDVTHVGAPERGPDRTHVGALDRGPAQTHVGVLERGSDVTHVGALERGPAQTHVGVLERESDVTHVGVLERESDVTHVGAVDRGPAQTHVGVLERESDVTDVGALDRGPAQTHVGALARGPAPTHVGVLERESDVTHVGAVDRGPDKSHVPLERSADMTHVGALDRGPAPTHVGALDRGPAQTHVGALDRGPDKSHVPLERSADMTHVGALDRGPAPTHVGALARGPAPTHVGALDRESDVTHVGVLERESDVTDVGAVDRGPAPTHVGALERGSDVTHVGAVDRGPAQTHVGVLERESDVTHVGVLERESDVTHVGALARGPAPTHVGALDRGPAPTHVGALERESDVTHVGAVDRGPDKSHVPLERSADMTHVGALLERARRAIGDVAATWATRADLVATLDAELREALAAIELASRAAERALADAVARRDTTKDGLARATSEHAELAARLESARIAAGFDSAELRRLLAESSARVEQLTQHLDTLERVADRARTLVGERRRHLDVHRATSPFDGGTNRQTDQPDMAGPERTSDDPLRSTPSRADASRADASRADASRADASRADASRADASRADASRADGLRADAARVDELAAAVTHADHHAAALAATLAADKDARTRRAEALAMHAAAEQAAEIDRVLGEVIGSHDGKLFRSFAQSLTLDGLLAVANSHLEELSPRYQLERVPRHDLELQVIDRDLGNEIRSVQSLSGGESFLVSLALALGLSSMSAHDVRVRTLLIDEGFGTLDPATLDSALAVLDALQATGRQVGVISHVPALVERVGAHVRVYPRGGGRSEVIVADA